MGDMADMYDCLLDEEQQDVAEYFNNGPEWLVEHSASARKPIVTSIRAQWLRDGRMTAKQQWVLAYWVAEQDAKYA